MNKKMSKRQRDIKTKLMAAVAMLLVSSIMMVSTTYAWFTLSTAPEVTGISTAVGANGNLEMALMPKTGGLAAIKSEVGDSTKDIEARNITWGNLVDLSNSSIYGLDEIKLYPSALNLDAAGAVVPTSMLKTPTYGADGRVDSLVANTVTGYFDKQTQTFKPNSDMGVRAVGTASGMTDRQLDYRNARAAVNTAKALAANLASTSLNNNGSALANIAIEYGMGADSASFDKTDVAALRKIINDLKNDGGVLDQIETAYLQAILAYSASAAAGDADTVWSAVKGEINKDDSTLTSVTTALTGAGVAMPTQLTTAIGEYNDTVAAVGNADTALATLEAKIAQNDAATFTWEEIKTAMTPLANPAAMTINGFKASEVKANLGALVSSVTAQGGLVVTMATGAGVYADIADQAGDYTASITIQKVEYNGIALENMTARMNTATTVNPVYLARIAAAVEAAGAPSGGAGADLPISDMYGYVIDLAFRTNAADSNLMLQVEEADRIYSDNTNEETMGHGANMTFAATTNDFSNDQVKGLMDAIRIVFFDPSNGKIIANAKLDVAKATYGADGWTADIAMYDVSDGTTTYRLAKTGETATHVEVITYEAEENGAYIADSTAAGGYRPATGEETGTHKQVISYAAAGDGQTATHVEVKAAAGAMVLRDDTKIMALPQNVATSVSVLVYLDGNNMGNDDVAATAASSMTGKMNLQFCSSATLIPMEYADLYQSDAEKFEVSLPADGSVLGKAQAVEGKPYDFNIVTGKALSTVTVAGTAVTPTDNGNGSYTIPADKVTGNIVITTTAAPTT